MPTWIDYFVCGDVCTMYVYVWTCVQIQMFWGAHNSNCINVDSLEHQQKQLKKVEMAWHAWERANLFDWKWKIDVEKRRNDRENFTFEYFGLDRLKILCINSQSTLFKFDVFVIC